MHWLPLYTIVDSSVYPSGYHNQHQGIDILKYEIRDNNPQI